MSRSCQSRSCCLLDILEIVIDSVMDLTFHMTMSHRMKTRQLVAFNLVHSPRQLCALHCAGKMIGCVLTWDTIFHMNFGTGLVHPPPWFVLFHCRNQLMFVTERCWCSCGSLAVPECLPRSEAVCFACQRTSVSQRRVSTVAFLNLIHLFALFCCRSPPWPMTVIVWMTRQFLNVALGLPARPQELCDHCAIWQRAHIRFASERRITDVTSSVSHLADVISSVFVLQLIHWACVTCEWVVSWFCPIALPTQFHRSVAFVAIIQRRTLLLGFCMNPAGFKLSTFWFRCEHVTKVMWIHVHCASKKLRMCPHMGHNVPCELQHRSSACFSNSTNMHILYVDSQVACAGSFLTLAMKDLLLSKRWRLFSSIFKVKTTTKIMQERKCLIFWCVKDRTIATACT